jgi:hypothetical protein
VSAVDALAIILVAFGALWGLLHGAIRQIASFLGWVVAIALPYFFAAFVGHFISDQFDTPYVIGLVIAGVVLGLAGQILARVVFFLIRKLVRRLFATASTIGRDEEEKKEAREERFEGGLSDHILGAIIGGGKWAFGLWVLLSSVAILSRPLHARGYALGVERSAAFELADRHNALALLWKQDFRKLDEALRRLSDVRRITDKKAQDAANALAKDERVRKLMSDDRLREALRKGEVKALLESPEVIALVTDQAMMERAFVVAAASFESMVKATE